MKFRRLCKAVITAAVSMMLFSTPVLAGTFDFNVELNESSTGIAYSDNSLKNRDANYAEVKCLSSNISSADYFTFDIVGQVGDYTSFSESIQATAVTGTYHLQYNKPVFMYNNYRLRGSSYVEYLIVHTVGVWEP